jgi:hypothetical protein
MTNFCTLHGNTDAPCPECQAFAREQLESVRRKSAERQLVLKRLEWKGNDVFFDQCPCCRALRTAGGHAAQCAMAAALQD